MKTVKFILIAIEIACVIGVVCLEFCTDWAFVAETGNAWSLRVLIIFLAINGIVCQREQQAIDLDEEEA